MVCPIFRHTHILSRKAPHFEIKGAPKDFTAQIWLSAPYQGHDPPPQHLDMGYSGPILTLLLGRTPGPCNRAAMTRSRSDGDCLLCTGVCNGDGVSSSVSPAKQGWKGNPNGSIGWRLVVECSPKTDASASPRYGKLIVSVGRIMSVMN